MKDYHINVFYSDEDEGYIADIPDLRHCSAFGETPEEALAEVLKAKVAWIKAAKAARKPIPPVVPPGHLPGCVDRGGTESPTPVCSCSALADFRGL
jgi:predicted RNase H-like HicB family nuclease